MMIDFRIDTFLVVYQYRNYTKAAEVLSITQSAAVPAAYRLSNPQS